MTAEDLLQLGPVAVVAIVCLREAIGAWKWREERRAQSEAEKHEDEVRALVTTVREDLASARAQLRTIVDSFTSYRDSNEEVWRELYQALQEKVETTNRANLERVGEIALRSANALEQASLVIEEALRERDRE